MTTIHQTEKEYWLFKGAVDVLLGKIIKKPLVSDLNEKQTK
jgi:hypothetical protein